MHEKRLINGFVQEGYAPWRAPSGDISTKVGLGVPFVASMGAAKGILPSNAQTLTLLILGLV